MTITLAECNRRMIADDPDNAVFIDEPTIVETLEEAAFILEETPDAVILIRPKAAA